MTRKMKSQSSVEDLNRIKIQNDANKKGFKLQLLPIRYLSYTGREQKRDRDKKTPR